MPYPIRPRCTGRCPAPSWAEARPSRAGSDRKSDLMVSAVYGYCYRFPSRDCCEKGTQRAKTSAWRHTSRTRLYCARKTETCSSRAARIKHNLNWPDAPATTMMTKSSWFGTTSPSSCRVSHQLSSGSIGSARKHSLMFIFLMRRWQTKEVLLSKKESFLRRGSLPHPSRSATSPLDLTLELLYFFINMPPVLLYQ